MATGKEESEGDECEIGWVWSLILRGRAIFTILSLMNKKIKGLVGTFWSFLGVIMNRTKTNDRTVSTSSTQVYQKQIMFEDKIWKFYFFYHESA